MRTSMTVFLLAVITACLAMPTTMPTTAVPSTTSASPKPILKDAVRMLLESSELLQNWGNTVLDTSETGLDEANVQQLMLSGANARKRFHDTVIEVTEMLKEDADNVEDADTFHKDVAEGAVQLLKEEAQLEDFTDDEKLALISGDKLSADTMRLRINIHLFTRSMKVLDGTVAGLEALLGDDVTDADIMEVLPELVELLGSEGTALGMVFKAIQENFDDAADLFVAMADEEDDTEQRDEDKQDEDDVKTADSEEEDSEEVEDRPSRQRRQSSPTFGRSSSSTFGRSGSSSTFGRGSTSTFGRRPGSSFNKNLGNGWSVGLGGVTWSRRNTRINVGPTFGRGGLGVQAGIRIEF